MYTPRTPISPTSRPNSRNPPSIQPYPSAGSSAPNNFATTSASPSATNPGTITDTSSSTSTFHCLRASIPVTNTTVRRPSHVSTPNNTATPSNKARSATASSSAPTTTTACSLPPPAATCCFTAPTST